MRGRELFPGPHGKCGLQDSVGTPPAPTPSRRGLSYLGHSWVWASPKTTVQSSGRARVAGEGTGPGQVLGLAFQKGQYLHWGVCCCPHRGEGPGDQEPQELIRSSAGTLLQLRLPVLSCREVTCQALVTRP